jgi:cytochrome c biogenesis protein CcdA
MNENLDGLIWFGGIALILIGWLVARVVRHRLAVAKDARAWKRREREQAMYRHPAAVAQRAQEDAAGRALRLQRERAVKLGRTAQWTHPTN